MARVRARVDDFEDGVYPDVCASSGADGARVYRAVATYRPGWVWLLLIGGPPGFVAAFVLSVVLRKSVHGYVPYTAAVQATLLRRSRRYAQGAAASLLLLLGALVLAVSNNAGTGFSDLAAIGFVMGGIGLVMSGFLWSNVPGSVGAKLESNGRWVVLEPASNRFAFAFEQQEARRRAVRRAAASDGLYLDG